MKKSKDSKRQYDFYQRWFERKVNNDFKSRATQELCYHAVKDLLAEKSADEICTIPRKPPNTQYLTKTEYADLLRRTEEQEPVGLRDKAAFRLGAEIGVGVGELIEILAKDVFQNADRFYVRTNKQTYYLTRDIYDDLMRYWTQIPDEWKLRNDWFWYGNDGSDKELYFVERRWKGKGLKTHGIWGRLTKYFKVMRQFGELRFSLRGKFKLLERMPDKIPQDPEYIDRL